MARRYATEIDWGLQAKKLAEAIPDVQLTMDEYAKGRKGFEYTLTTSDYPPSASLIVYFAGHPSSRKNYGDDGHEFSDEETKTMLADLEALGWELGIVYTKHNLAGKSYHSGGKIHYTFWPKTYHG